MKQTTPTIVVRPLVGYDQPSAQVKPVSYGAGQTLAGNGVQCAVLAGPDRKSDRALEAHVARAKKAAAEAGALIARYEDADRDLEGLETPAGAAIRNLECDGWTVTYNQTDSAGF